MGGSGHLHEAAGEPYNDEVLLHSLDACGDAHDEMNTVSFYTFNCILHGSCAGDVSRTALCYLMRLYLTNTEWHLQWASVDVRL